MKKNYLRGKKATIPFNVLLAVIMIVVSFLVILFFYWQYNWKGEINKQTCHESVILKASIPKILDRPVAVLPLRCITEKICITDKFFGGKCSGFGSEGKNVKMEKVSKDKEKQKEEIKDVIANSLYDCWSMMGEGKVNVFSREFHLKKYSSRCVICARIDFDDELKKEIGPIQGLSEYLDTKPIPNKNMNYSQFLIGFKGERPYGKLLEGEQNPGRDIFGIEQQAIVFQEFDRTTAPEYITAVIGGIAAAAGVAYVTSYLPVAFTAAFKLTTLAFAGGSYIGRKGGALIGGLIGDDYIASWAFAPYSTDKKSIETEYVKEVTNDGKTCYAKIDSKVIPEGLDKNYSVYGLGENREFMNGKTKLSEKVLFPDKTDKSETAEKQRGFLNKVLEELTIKCYDLTSFQCDEFESYA